MLYFVIFLGSNFLGVKYSSTNCLLLHTPPSSRIEQFICIVLNTLLLVKFCSYWYFLPVFATRSFPCQNPPLNSSPSHLACLLLTPELFGNFFNKYLWSLCVFQVSLLLPNSQLTDFWKQPESLSETLWAEHSQKGLREDLVSMDVWELCWSLSLFLWKGILDKTFRYTIFASWIKMFLKQALMKISATWGCL